MSRNLLLHATANTWRPILLIAAFAALLPLPAQAAKWVSIGNRGGAKIEVDASSLNRVSDDKFRIWHRESYARPQIPDSGAFSFGSLTALSEFQCTKRLAVTLRRNYIATNGSELKSENHEGRDPAPVVPDSIGEAVFNYACKARLAPPPPVEEAPPPAPVVVDDARSAKKKSKAGKDEPPPPPPVAWDYEGKAGASRWGKLSSDYATCGLGQRQSPIDIRDTISGDLPPIRFAYKAVPLSITDNGHTIQVDTPGGGIIKVDGEDYELQQFHFHRPSEERINGKTYEMAVHLEHRAKSGKLAVLAVMLQAGKEQQLIRTLWSNLPLERNKAIDRTDIMIDPTLLLPATRSYYTYIGSLSTPPCSEGVLWLVLKTPAQVSKEQIASFGRIYKNNTRPIQPRNARIIKESR